MTDVSSTLQRAEFIAQFGGIYEHSEWIAERAFDNGELPDFVHESDRQPCGEIRTLNEAKLLAASLAKTLAASNEQEKLSLIQAHPDLVGKAALAGELTAESNVEQSSAGLDQCTEEELLRFQNANAAYKECFGFPFIMAVRGADRQSILKAFEQRLNNNKQAEFDTALVEIDKIALLRLEALVKS